MGRIRKIGSANLQLFTNLISIFNVYTKLVIQLQKWNATVLLRKSGRLASQYAAMSIENKCKIEYGTEQGSAALIYGEKGLSSLPIQDIAGSI